MPSSSSTAPTSCGCTPSTTNESTLAFSARGADEPHAVELADPLGGVGEQLLLPGADGGAPDRLDVVERRAQADDLGDRRRAGLEPRRRRRPGASARASPSRSCRRRPARAASPRAAPRVRTARRCRWARTPCGRRRRRSRSRAPARPPAGAAPTARRPPATDAALPRVRHAIQRDRVDGAQRVGDVRHGDEPRAIGRAGARTPSRSSSPASVIGTARSVAPVCVGHAAARERCSSGAPSR